MPADQIASFGDVLELPNGGGIPEVLLQAISCGAVFLGALTYIGNGPNFLVLLHVAHDADRRVSARSASSVVGAVLPLRPRMHSTRKPPRLGRT